MKKIVLLAMILAAGKLYAQVAVAKNPNIIYKPDTILYLAGKYKVAPSAKVMQLLKAMEGFEIAADSSVTHQGQQVNYIRINGKHYDGMTVANVTTRLPADVVENIEVIDDYGNAARSSFKNLGPDKLLNINIKKNRIIDLRSFGYRGGGQGQNTGAYAMGNGYYNPADTTRRYRRDVYGHRKPGYIGRNLEDRNETDRAISRRIAQLQYDIEMQGRDVDDYGDQVPHHLPAYANWPQPKAKSAAADTVNVKKGNN